MSDQELEISFPFIAWRSPVMVRAENVARLCCRYCMAQRGLAANEVKRVGFETTDEFERHLAAAHPRRVM
jgi:hypothetical protein